MAGTFDVEAALTGLAELMKTMPALESARIGAPESLSATISAWVTVGDPDVIGSPVTGIFELPINLIAWFGYGVGGSEAAAEAQLADWVSELTRRLIQNRMGSVTGNAITVTRNLNGAVDRMGLPQAAAGAADYTLMAGLEVRTFPLGVRIVQRETIG